MKKAKCLHQHYNHFAWHGNSSWKMKSTVLFGQESSPCWRSNTATFSSSLHRKASCHWINLIINTQLALMSQEAASQIQGDEVQVTLLITSMGFSSYFVYLGHPGRPGKSYVVFLPAEGALMILNRWKMLCKELLITDIWGFTIASHLAKRHFANCCPWNLSTWKQN